MISRSSAKIGMPRGGTWVFEGCFAAIAAPLSSVSISVKRIVILLLH